MVSVLSSPQSAKRKDYCVSMCGLKFITFKSLKLVEVKLINVVNDFSDFVTVI